MANTNTIWHQAPHTVSHLSAAQQEPQREKRTKKNNKKLITKTHTHTQNRGGGGGGGLKNGPLAEKVTRQKEQENYQTEKRERGDREVKSNDSPEIPEG